MSTTRTNASLVLQLGPGWDWCEISSGDGRLNSHRTGANPVKFDHGRDPGTSPRVRSPEPPTSRYRACGPSNDPHLPGRHAQPTGARRQARLVLVTIAPFDDVELNEGSTVAQLRSQLAEVTGRPELSTSPLTVDGIRLEATQVCGHEPLLAGAIVHLGPSRPDAARAAVCASWHVAVIDGPDAGHLLGPGRDGSLVLNVTAPLVGQRSGSAEEGRGTAVRILDDGRPTTVEVRVRASRLWTRVWWRTGHRRWHLWRAGRELAIQSSRFELRWRPDREPTSWRRRRSRGDAQDRRRVRTAATASSLVPLFSSVGLAIALHSATLLLIGLASVVALTVTRRFDGHRTREGSPGAAPAATGPGAGGLAATEPGRTTTRGSRVTTSQPAELSRWLAGPPSEAVWRGPSPGLDLPPERCLGVVGYRERARSAVRAMVTAAVARSEPGSLEVTVLGPGATAANWGWARWLPTSVHLVEHGRPGALLDHDRDLPLLCVADGPLSPRDATRLAGWWHQAATGSSLILIVDRAEDRPAWCHALLDVEAGALVAADGTTRPVRTPGVSAAWAEHTARRLLGRRTLLGAAGRLHRPVPLTGLAGLPRPEPASISAAWGARRTAGAPELRAPIGTTSDGRPLVLELSRDGPHVLIAGTTGAGKSELLQSLVISLAAQHSPAALTFALVDFKGGASLGPCVRLPHVTGRVSDLDPLLARRAVAGLRAELRRREAVLAEAGVTDLDGLWRRAQSQGTRSAGAAGAAGSSDPGCAPPPRLVVVVDELRALVDDVPEAMPTIARIAAQGRALGIHLVLATQRPAGALSPDARANIGIRIALRVADPADSLDVLGIPDAAQIRHDRPGQALLRVAAATPVPFQTARVGGHAEDTAVVRLVGAPPESGPPVERPSPDDAWVDAVSAAGERERLPRTPPLWQPPLPEQVDLADLPDGSTSPDTRSHALVWGLADLVDEQRQGPACWHPDAGNLLVVGRPGAGRTTALRTLAISALRSGREVHVISGSPARFADLSGWEGFGTIVAANDGRLAHRLLDLLRRGATPGPATRARTPTGGLAGPRASPPDRVPLLLLDDLPDLIRTLEARSRSAPDVLGAVMRASGGAGLSIVASAAPDSLGRELSAYLPQRLILAAGDATAAVADGVPRALAGIPSRPGLGVWLGTQPAVLVQVAQARIEQSRPVAASIDLTAIDPTALDLTEIDPRPEPVRLRPLPADAGTPGVSRCAITAVPLGLGGDTAEPVLVDLSERGFLVVGPPRSGRSTALAVLATALLDRCAEALIVSRRGPLLTLAPSSSRARVTITDRPTMEQVASADLIVLDDLDDLERRDPDRCAEVCARSVAERSPGPIILASANTERASISFRGLLGELRRAGCGLVLGADVPGSKEVFMAPIEAHIDDDAGHPGRGVLLDRDGAVPLQVHRAP